MNVKESNLLTNHPSQIDKHVLEIFLGYWQVTKDAEIFKYILSK